MHMQKGYVPTVISLRLSSSKNSAAGHSTSWGEEDQAKAVHEQKVGRPRRGQQSDGLIMGSLQTPKSET